MKIDRENQPANQPEKTFPGLRGRALDFLVIEFGDADADNCVPGFFVIEFGDADTDNCVPGFFVVQHGIAPPSSRNPVHKDGYEKLRYLF